MCHTHPRRDLGRVQSLQVAHRYDHPVRLLQFAYGLTNGALALDLRLRFTFRTGFLTARLLDRWTKRRALGLADGYSVKPGGKFTWLPDAKAFLNEHRIQLNAKKTALFIVGASMMQDTPETRAAVKKAFIDPILDEYFETAPVSIGLFGGAFDLTKEQYTLFERFVLRILGLILRLPDKKKADWRNWDTIDAWAAEVGDKMK